MKAAIYTRVSTAEQTDNLSLPTQRRACEEYCANHDLEVVKVFVERGESAKTAERTELRNLLSFCMSKRGTVDAVVVYALSRFARSTADHYSLRTRLADHGIRLHSVTEPIDDSPTGKMMETMLAGFAQFDNDIRSARTRAGMLTALQGGRWTFRAPLGFTNGARGGPSLLVEPAEAKVVREIFALFAAGRLPALIVERLQAAGQRPRNGTAWSLQTLHNVLRNPVYVGRIEIPKMQVSARGDFEPLIAEAQFNRVQERLGAFARATGSAPRSRQHPDFPLRRFVKCGECHKPMTAAWSSGRSVKYAYYECARCRARVPKRALEDAFSELLDGLRPRPEYTKLFRAIVLDVWKRRAQTHRADRWETEKRVERLYAKLDRVTDLLTDGTLDAAEFARQRDRVRQEIGRAEAELEQAVVDHLDVEAVLAFGESLLTEASRMWAHASPEHRQRLQQAIYPAGLVWDAREGCFEAARPAVAFMLPEAAGPAQGMVRGRPVRIRQVGSATGIRTPV